MSALFSFCVQLVRLWFGLFAFIAWAFLLLRTGFWPDLLLLWARFRSWLLNWSGLLLHRPVLLRAGLLDRPLLLRLRPGLWSLLGCGPDLLLRSGLLLYWPVLFRTYLLSRPCL